MRGFSIDAFRAVVGCRDEAVKARLLAKVDDAFSRPPSRDAARGWVERIVSGEIATTPPEFEDDVLQSVVVLVALDQDVVDPKIFFWETMMPWVEAVASHEEGPRRKVMSWLLHGRPCFSRRIETSWAYCAFIPNAQIEELVAVAGDRALVEWHVGRLRALKTDEERASARAFNEERQDAAVAWLKTMAREGKDVLFACS